MVHLNDFINKIYIQVDFYNQAEMTLPALFAAYYHSIRDFFVGEKIGLLMGLGFALRGYFAWETFLCWVTLSAAYLLTSCSAAIYHLCYILPAFVLVLIPATAWLNLILTRLSRSFKALICLVILGFIMMHFTAYLPLFSRPSSLTFKYINSNFEEANLSLKVSEYNRVVQALSQVIIKDYRPVRDFYGPVGILIYNDLGILDNLCTNLIYYLAFKLHQEFLVEYMRNDYAQYDFKKYHYLIYINQAPKTLTALRVKLLKSFTLEVLREDKPLKLKFYLYKF
jgi:hypothetical protein